MPTPARIITDLHETLVQNPLATALLGPAGRASFVEQWFSEPECRSIYPAEDHPHHSRVLAADLRAAVANRDHDRQSTEMVARLRKASPEFAALWGTGDVAVRRGDRKRSTIRSWAWSTSTARTCSARTAGSDCSSSPRRPA